MDNLILENVRCFHERQQIRLAPLTLLVGENSTGKSTILAATRLAWDLAQGTIEPDFNEEPFDWGGYDQIAHYRKGKAGRAKSFVIGLETPVAVRHRSSSKSRARETVVVEARFGQRGAQPRLHELVFRHKRNEFRAVFEPEGNKVRVSFKPKGKSESKAMDLGLGARLPRIPIPYLFMHWSPEFQELSESRSAGFLEAISRWPSDFPSRPYAIAPVRTRPLRTYDPRRETPRPEGEHVPMILARGNAADDDDWKRLQESLREFGVPSGLFSDLDVKRLGKKETDPFQLQVTVQGPPANLMDVGYGVSQVLPIAVDCLRSKPGQTLLMQQPEVHLHPRGQAELGTFLARLVKNRQNCFIVETHSDYLVNRVRLDLRDKRLLKPEDVCLLYCEQSGLDVRVQEIHLDEQGNMIDAPPGYRRFFLDEEKRFFGE